MNKEGSGSSLSLTPQIPNRHRQQDSGCGLNQSCCSDSLVINEKMNCENFDASVHRIRDSSDLKACHAPRFVVDREAWKLKGTLCPPRCWRVYSSVIHLDKEKMLFGLK